ncbi:MAG TPA: hypothetical protein VNW52_09955 [Burkholderiaceae bacterium]|jgi:hypothetical protein|nr:hypothetical protein [Burkholderiaceae bacterium]
MNKDVATFEAKCAKCGSQFEHPSFGDFTYGEIILYTIDGLQKAWANAFSAFPQRVKSMLDPPRSKKFWEILASVADPIDGQKLVAKIVCPNCASDHMDYWNGKQIGVTPIQEATFSHLCELDDATLAIEIAAVTD